MKILVIQLTRLGDILCTLPTLSAMRRDYPDAQIHLLVRSRFAQAAEGHLAIDHLWKLDAQKILGNLISDSVETKSVGQEKADASLASLSQALIALSQVISELRAEKFDKIINLSFSPSSSFIAHLISQGKIPVVGYSRTSDFYLHIPDEASRYFRSHVGIDKSNRIHVIDIFSWVAGVKIKSSDLCSHDKKLRDGGIVCHLGASQKQKRWPDEHWTRLLQRLTTELETQVTLVGTEAEAPWINNIALQVGASSQLRNLAGKTNYAELKRIIERARLFIGADSGPMHVANIVATPTLNLSVGNVRFWETGPIVAGSRVFQCRNPKFLSSDEIFVHAKEMFKGESTIMPVVECMNQNGVRYTLKNEIKIRQDQWSVVEWMHFYGPKPEFPGELSTALNQIVELSKLAISQLEAFYKDSSKAEIVSVLDRVDELMNFLMTNISPVAPLIEEFLCQKENIPPLSREEVFHQTKRCYEVLCQRGESLLQRELKTQQEMRL